jgi:Coenzyme PQQ synthesis protein D (PqqD)
VPEPTIDAANTVSRRDGLIAERLLDETVVLDPSADTYARLNPTGGWLWDRLSTPQTLNALAEAVATEFQLDEARALEDVKAFIRGLLERGLVETA